MDPDDTYNETPYEKGFCFVSYLAHLVGDLDQFDKFLKVPSTPRLGRRKTSGQCGWARAGGQRRAEGGGPKDGLSSRGSQSS